jgi:RNA polymerase primary sigma factor
MAAQKMLLGPWPGQDRAGAERSAPRDESVEGWGCRNRPRSGVARVHNEARERRLLDQKLEYVHDRRFDQPDALASFCVPMPAGSHEATRLRPDEEVYLFLKMNYLKYRAGKLREALDPSSASASDLDEIERLEGQALAVKNQIVQSNLGLVVPMARRWAGPGRNFLDLVSDGNLSLILAAEKFDVSRGFKFSTYATSAIIRRFSRATVQGIGRRRRFVTGRQELLEAAAARRIDEPLREPGRPGNEEAVRGMLGLLSDRERGIIIGRFGLGGSRPKSRDQLGKELGISKERVRQIELRAREKLHKVAMKEGLDPTAA